MTPNERLKEIEEDWTWCEHNRHKEWLINRVKRLTQVLEYMVMRMTEVKMESQWLDDARKALEDS